MYMFHYKNLKKIQKRKGKKGVSRASGIDFFYSKQRDSPCYMIYHNHLICLIPLKKEQWIQEKVLICKKYNHFTSFFVVCMGHFPLVL